MLRLVGKQIIILLTVCKTVAIKIKGGISMAWKTIKCSYCGYKKDITVNAEVKKFTSLCSCQKCHKQYWYVTEFGRVSVKKK